MDPNSSPWSYAYNRIVPSASSGSSAEEFQHPHLATITAGQSAQSLLLQAAHSGIGFNTTAGGTSFVSPSPISGYNPVFQQIYHHAAAASVQPKPAHYASSAVNTPHRQLQIPASLDKQLSTFQNQAAVAAVSSAAAAVANTVASNYYGENSSSSGASPSPTTAAITSTTLSWNSPMISNTFLAMQQQQQQQQQQQTQQQHQQQLNLVSEKVQIKQEDSQTKAHDKAYNDTLYLAQIQQQEDAVAAAAQLESEAYYTIEGKNYKIVRKPQQVLQVEQNVSPAAYPVYASPSLSSAGDSPAAVTNLHASEATPPQVIVYKTNAASTTAVGAQSPIRRNVASAGSPATVSTVAYSSVIQSTLQQQQQQQIHLHNQQTSNCWTKVEEGSNSNDVKNVLQLQVKQEHRHLGYATDGDIGENLIFNLPPGLEIKQTFYHPDTGAPAGTSVVQHTQHQQQLLAQQNNNQALHPTVYENPSQKVSHLQHQQQHHHEKQRRQHMVANMLMSPTANSHSQHATDHMQNISSSNASSVLPSQIQIIPKVEEPPKQQLAAKPAKTPRKRQPKKTLIQNDYAAVRSPQQEPATPQHLQQQQQQQQQHAQQQQQQQQQQASYYDFNNKWNTPLKIENNTPSPVAQVATISIPTYVNPHAAQQQAPTPQQQQQQQQQQQHAQQTQQQLPQPAHLQSSQAQSHPHLTNLTSYYSTFPQQIASQYSACMQQSGGATGAIQHSLYNLNQQQQQQHQQQQQQHQQQQHQQQQQQHAQATQQQQHQQQQQQQQQHATQLQQSQAGLQQQQPAPVEQTNTPAVDDIANKVIVPNIEEELDFLTDPADLKSSYAVSNGRNNSIASHTNFGLRNPNGGTNSNNPVTNNGGLNATHMVGSGYGTGEKKPICGTSIGEKKTQFMDSYLKFLQGERDDSPPPVAKSGRKVSYQKMTNNVSNVGGAGKRSKSTTSEDAVQTNIDQQEQGASQGVIGTGEDSHKIKILSQTQILPKKRPHAQMTAATANTSPSPGNSNSPTASVIQHPADQIQQQPQQQPEAFRPYGNQPQHLQQQQQQQYANQSCPPVGLGARSNSNATDSSQDPLSLPPRREQSLRKAKQTSIHAMLMNATDAGGNAGNEDQLAEPDEFADSDTDPVWTPQEEDSDDGKEYKRRAPRRSKGTARKTILNNHHQHQTQEQTPSVQPQQQQQQQQQPQQQQPHHAQQQQNAPTNSFNSNQELTNNSNFSNTPVVADNFKTGDFIVLRSDLVNDWPTIWQVDSKCILQKYEPFCQNGKMFYRNMSKYASWNLETKKLYLKAPVRIQIQSHTETIVEFMRSELLADDTEQFIEKIMEDYLSYRDHFEIYIQTMISQVLDPSFFSEITREKDEYFLGSVRAVDTIMENCKRKLLSITPWTRGIISSIETWPKCHVFTEWGQNNVTQKNCGGCLQPGISVRFLLFGHPYNPHTMQTVPTDARVSYEKDILLCRICAARADIFHKIAHEKYNLYINCSRRVAEQQQENPGKTSTEILNDLLAEHNWVDELFRNMRNSWAEVESLERQKRFRDGAQ